MCFSSALLDFELLNVTLPKESYLQCPEKDYEMPLRNSSNGTCVGQCF